MAARIGGPADILLRTAQFLLGVFVMSMGTAMTVRALLGTTPVSSLPVALEPALPFTIGMLTAMLNILMLLAQILILRRRFPPLQVLQVGAAFAFGAACDLSLWILRDLEPSGYPAQLALSLGGSALLGVGVWIQVSAKAIYLAPEGLVAAIAQVTGREFSTIKILNDLVIVAVAVLCSLLLYGRLEGVREGTVAAVFLVGLTVKACRWAWARLRSRGGPEGGRRRICED
ncbi:YitT family protein [Gulosibacter sp. 10]|uniref:YczE/YyaS/YitT family protein n=1 Tax=Gulosibacter sp. 10 TaxID=1255570 RepID=UPI00097F5E86|nr:DUF6198 family protein [Gulosibacter sp. 10]SJM67474.1 hypothetical protein FM112_12615 [Gulosibacter sp. 10]